MNMRGHFFICGSLLQSVIFLLFIQFQQISCSMSTAKEDSFRAHRAVIPWTHILAEPVSDGESCGSLSPGTGSCPQVCTHGVK